MSSRAAKYTVIGTFPLNATVATVAPSKVSKSKPKPKPKRTQVDADAYYKLARRVGEL